MRGVTYKSAWFMARGVREAMEPGSVGLMGTGGGTLEADETYWDNNGKQRKGARGYQHKIKVVSLVERGGEKRSVVMQNVNAKTLTALLEDNVCSSAHLMTDEHAGYVKAGRKFL